MGYLKKFLVLYCFQIDTNPKSIITFNFIIKTYITNVFVSMFTYCAIILHARILCFLIDRNVFRCPRDFCLNNGRAVEKVMDYYYLVILAQEQKRPVHLKFLVFVFYRQDVFGGI